MLSGYSGTRRSGFSLLEMLIVLVLLAVAIVPMLSAFSPTLVSQSAEKGSLVFHNRARGTLARVMTNSFSALDANESSQVDLVTLFGGAGEAARELFVFRGSNYQPQVAITDVSGGTGGLLEVSVKVENLTLSTRKAEY